MEQGGEKARHDEEDGQAEDVEEEDAEVEEPVGVLLRIPPGVRDVGVAAGDVHAHTDEHHDAAEAVEGVEAPVCVRHTSMKRDFGRGSK